MAAWWEFTEEEMVIDEGLGYPKAYGKLCRDPHLNPYNHGPPFTFIPYTLQPQEDSTARDLDQMFPVIDPEAKPSTKPKIFTSLLWKQLNHLGSAGFDPAKFRVDPYGNVLYYHADSASPLAWAIDHWFPCTRGGRTVPSNLRLLQRQVYKKKHNKLEFHVPWWDLQLGISINQFLNIFASSNSDFRYRAFSFLFSEGENEELNDSQTVESHIFPQHFIETKQKVGLAPAAIVLSRRESSEASSTLRSLDLNRRLKPNSPATAAGNFWPDDNQSVCKSIQRYRASSSKENDNPNMDATNPYLVIAKARDSLKQREEREKMQAEIQKLDKELDEMKQNNEVERMALQDLELVLIKRRRRAEKCRRLAEEQSSYRVMLEKMIRDAMHQSVIYKEHIRLNQAAANALMARLEAQKAICNFSERELHKKFKHRDEIEKQIRPWEHTRKRSRMDDDALFDDEGDDKTILYLPGIRPTKPLQKELRVFLQEEQKASEVGLSLNQERQHEEIEEKNNEVIEHTDRENPEEHNKSLLVVEDQTPIEDNPQKSEIDKPKNMQCQALLSPEIEEEEEFRKQPGKGNAENWLQKSEIGEPNMKNVQCSVIGNPEREEEDEESRKQRGKGNVEKWLQMLLDNTEEGLSINSHLPNVIEQEPSKTDETIRKLNHKNPQEVKVLQFPASEDILDLKLIQKEIRPQIVHERDDGKRKEQIFEKKSGETMGEKTNTSEVGRGIGSRMSFEGKEKREKAGKERGLVRSESARSFRPIPSSPSVILGMRKGVDCIRKKPIVIGSDEDEDPVARSNFIKSSIKTIKKAVKI